MTEPKERSPKEIVARDQVALGAQRGLRLALVSMSYRLFRSGVTVAILALAVAFLVHMVSHGILSQRTQENAERELAADRELGERITRLFTVDSSVAIGEQLSTGGQERLAEFRHFSGAQPAELERARATARELRALGRELLDLPVTARSALLADLSPSELFARLSTRDQVDEFSADLRRLKVWLRSTSDLPGLFLERRPELEKIVSAIAAGHHRAIEALVRAYPGQATSELVLQPPDDFVKTLQAVGFSIDRETLLELRRFAQREAAERTVAKLLTNSLVRAQVARQTRVDPGDVSMDVLLEEIESPGDARWLVTALREAEPTFELDESGLLRLLEGVRRERRLLAVSGEPVASENIRFGLSERNQWLIALSFLVCVVGVANAMLMSVTERFTEIATMKCLGAMDRFVMVLFVFEAIIQGALGGLVGVVVGILLALVRGLLEFGSSFLGAFAEPGALLLGIALSFGIGVVLAALAAVGPAFIAARLAPMEAMRVD